MSRRQAGPKVKAGSPAQPNVLGESLRGLRQRNGWSLAEVAAKTGLATSTLSRIENNRLSLTYEKLLQLAAGLGVDLAELLSGGGASSSGSKPSGRRAFTPPGEGRVIQTKSYYRYLCTELTAKKMTPIIGKVTATDLSELDGFLHHEGEEMVYVLEGVLEFHTEFYEPLRVEKGGCIYFDASMGHAFLAADGKAVTFLSVTSSPEPALQGAPPPEL